MQVIIENFGNTQSWIEEAIGNLNSQISAFQTRDSAFQTREFQPKQTPPVSHMGLLENRTKLLEILAIVEINHALGNTCVLQHDDLMLIFKYRSK